MSLPLLKIVLVMFATAVCLLWASIRILSPHDFKLSFIRCLGAALVMTVFGNASRIYLGPLIGDWFVLVSLLAYVLVIKAMFSLAFWRSSLVALIYIAGVAAVYFLIFSKTAH
jgi:hypothetical protein